MTPSSVQPQRKTKFIFITGGVVSSLGKGIAAASIGRLLVARGLTVGLQKFDPYINVDPGTMSPYQHGEVFVTEDGAETDLDIGHYERFLDTDGQLIALVVLVLVNLFGEFRSISNVIEKVPGLRHLDSLGRPG